MTGILTANAVGKSFGSRVALMPIIDGLTLDIAPGEFASPVGPSGCGKTTLLLCLSGLLSQTTGAVTFKGQPVNGPPMGLSVVFQDYSRSLLPWKSNLDNVLFGMRRVAMTAARKRDRAAEILTAVGLPDSRRITPGRCRAGCSSGWQ